MEDGPMIREAFKPNHPSALSAFSVFLRDGSTQLLESCSKPAAENYAAAMEILRNKSRKELRLTETDEALIKYCYAKACICRHTYEQIWKAIEIFDEILEEFSIPFPIAYYGKGLAYISLNRFTDAIEPLQNALDVIEKTGVHLEVHVYPGLPDKVIGESCRDFLREAIAGLLAVCRSPPSPVAICHEHGEDPNHSTKIYCNDPEFQGYVRATCRDQCHVEFHSKCFKKVADELKIHGDKGVIGHRCLTPDCESVFVKFQIFGSDGVVRKTLEEQIELKAKAPKTQSKNMTNVRNETTKKGYKKRLASQFCDTNDTEAQVVMLKSISQEPKTEIAFPTIPDLRSAEDALIILKKSDSDSNQTSKKLGNRRRSSVAESQINVHEAQGRRSFESQVEFPMLAAYLQQSFEESCISNMIDDSPSENELATVINFVTEFVSENGPISLSSQQFLGLINGFPIHLQEFISCHENGIFDLLNCWTSILFVGDVAFTREKLVTSLLAGSTSITSYLDLAIPAFCRQIIHFERHKLSLRRTKSALGLLSFKEFNAQVCESSQEATATPSNYDEYITDEDSEEDSESKSGISVHTSSPREIANNLDESAPNCPHLNQEVISESTTTGTNSFLSESTGEANSCGSVYCEAYSEVEEEEHGKGDDDFTGGSELASKNIVIEASRLLTEELDNCKYRLLAAQKQVEFERKCKLKEIKNRMAFQEQFKKAEINFGRENIKQEEINLLKDRLAIQQEKIRSLEEESRRKCSDAQSQVDDLQRNLAAMELNHGRLLDESRELKNIVTEANSLLTEELDYCKYRLLAAQKQVELERTCKLKEIKNRTAFEEQLKNAEVNYAHENNKQEEEINLLKDRLAAQQGKTRSLEEESRRKCSDAQSEVDDLQRNLAAMKLNYGRLLNENRELKDSLVFLKSELAQKIVCIKEMATKMYSMEDRLNEFDGLIKGPAGMEMKQSSFVEVANESLEPMDHLLMLRRELELRESNMTTLALRMYCSEPDQIQFNTQTHELTDFEHDNLSVNDISLPLPLPGYNPICSPPFTNTPVSTSTLPLNVGPHHDFTTETISSPALHPKAKLPQSVNWNRLEAFSFPQNVPYSPHSAPNSDISSGLSAEASGGASITCSRQLQNLPSQSPATSHSSTLENIYSEDSSQSRESIAQSEDFSLPYYGRFRANFEKISPNHSMFQLRIIYDYLRREFPNLLPTQFLTYFLLVRSMCKTGRPFGLKLKVIVELIRKEIHMYLSPRPKSTTVYNNPPMKGPSFWADGPGAEAGIKTPKKKGVKNEPTSKKKPKLVGDDVCAICLIEIDEGSAHYMRCAGRHCYHSRCIGRWYAKGKKSCPICCAEVPLHEDFPTLKNCGS